MTINTCLGPGHLNVSWSKLLSCCQYLIYCTPCTTAVVVTPWLRGTACGRPSSLPFEANDRLLGWAHCPHALLCVSRLRALPWFVSRYWCHCCVAVGLGCSHTVRGCCGHGSAQTLYAGREAREVTAGVYDKYSVLRMEFRHQSSPEVDDKSEQFERIHNPRV